MSEILLSICIPTFNRAPMLSKCIESIVIQEEFNHLVELVISDNCSDDNTFQIVDTYQKRYPNIIYNRNENNIGERNFIKVLSLARGRFLKLSNDYALFKCGSIKTILDVISSYQSSHSVLFFSNNLINLTEEIKECKNIDEFIKYSSYWITWILCFGIWKTEFDNLKNRDFSQSFDLNFFQVDLLLKNLVLGYKPVICNTLIISNQPLPAKSRYNIFSVFIQNYLTLLGQYVAKNLILKSTFKKEKKKLLYNFIFPWYCDLIINKNRDHNFETKGAKGYLMRYFNIIDFLKFYLKILNYYIARKQTKMIGKIKKNVLEKIANVTYKVIHSTVYKNLDEALKIEKFKFLGVNPRLPSQRIIKNPQYISIGKNFSALQNLRIEAWDEYAGEKFHPEIIIGDGVIMNMDIHIVCIDKIIIGNYVLFASRIYISDHSHGEITKEAISLPPSLRPLKSKGPVIIKDNVCIGEGVAILPGVTIGENCIIGANSVVTKSVPANCFVAGNPAKILKTLV